ncbi:MAG TPA: DUF58 domain-containing protein [Polyangia bacterium]|nr:DUF58 domain-containing protein [Polyangia bacterium]
MSDATSTVSESRAGVLLDPHDLARLATMSLRARVIVEGAFAGMHHNPHTGTSIEFAEHKEYAPGDDLRHMDWKAVARVERYYIKRFEDETEMRTFLLVDASASMGYRGSNEKSVSKLAYASYLAAALGYLLAQQGDPAGLLAFDERTRQYLPPRTRGGHLHELLVALDGLYAAGRTQPGRALAHVGELADRRSVIVLFTDLLDAPDAGGDELANRLRQLRARGHDVTLFHLLDPDEVELPLDDLEDLTEFEGVEPDDGRRLLVDPRDLAASFARESLALRERWRKRCLEARVEYRFATTSTPPSEVLRAFLFNRERERGRRS